MSIIVNRPYPIKICYLKDQNKPSQQQQQQKVSLTFLSSFIQQQKQSLVQKKQNQYPTYERQRQRQQQRQKYQNEQLDKQFLLNKPHTTGLNTYQRWRSRKTKSQSQDKRLLTNLVGTDWISGNVGELKNFKINRKLKKTIRERMETVQNDQRVQTNKKLLETQFRTFLSDKKQKPVIIQQVQQNCFVTKLDIRAFQSLKPQFMRKNRKIGYSFNHDTSERDKYQNASELKIKQHKPQLKNNSAINSTLLRHGFKQMGNFKWSRLNNNDRFKLNDHL